MTLEEKRAEVKALLTYATDYKSHNLPVLLLKKRVGEAITQIDNINDRISTGGRYLNEKSMDMKDVLNTMSSLNSNDTVVLRVKDYVVVAKSIDNYEVFKIESVDMDNPWTIVDENIVKYFVNGFNYLTLY